MLEPCQLDSESPPLDRQLLILDIDETLVFATEQALAQPHDFIVGPYFVYKRPHVDAFLTAVAEWFDLAVWTSSTEPYAAQVVRDLIPAPERLTFLWARSRCTRRYDPEFQEEYWLKDLKKVKRLGYSLERTIMIDDSPEKVQRQYGNHIHIRPFVGDASDAELQQLLPYLQFLRSVENVRQTEKRNWRSYLPPRHEDK
jgi:Dullard-like phosphatase family protein